MNDLQHTQERLAYALGQVAELRKRIPRTDTQTTIVDGPTQRQQDPLVRLLAAIRPAR